MLHLKFFIIFQLLFLSAFSFAQSVSQANYNIIPLPQEVTLNESGQPFVLSSATQIVFKKGNPIMERNAQFLAEYIREISGLDLKITSKRISRNVIELGTGLRSENREAYKLQVNANRILIDGASESGVFYGIQTLRKSLIPGGSSKKIELPQVQINDYPRFSYRGMMLDVGRHFFPAEFIKKYIDILALHNINRFHWHLTEDMGWRIEIKKYPKLIEIGSVRKETEVSCLYTFDGTPYGGFYTQDEVHEIVKYAAERHITIIPEIDLPGHILSALAAYPELGCTGGPYEVARTWGVYEDVLCGGKESTFEFLENVFTELMELFPSEYIHIGGDECPKTRWEKCPNCQARIKELGIKADEKYPAEYFLHSYITARVEKFLNKHGRKIIGWDEILEGEVAPNATVMSWRGMEGGTTAAKKGHDVIMSPYQHVYFDYYQSHDTEYEPCAAGFCLIDQVYNWNPVPNELSESESKHIIGVQANLWTEHVLDGPHVEYMTLPRIAALSEVQWTAQEKRNYSEFTQRIPQLARLYDVYDFNYSNVVFDIRFEIRPDYVKNRIGITLHSLGDQPIYYTTDGTEPTEQSLRYDGNPIVVSKDADINAAIIKNGRMSRTYEKKIRFSKSTAKRTHFYNQAVPIYNFTGTQLLSDGVLGSDMNYKSSGEWIGFQDKDLVAIIDMGRPIEVSSAALNTLCIQNDWIFNVGHISIEASRNGRDFYPVAEKQFDVLPSGTPDGIYPIKLSFKPLKDRYFKITLKPVIIPDWHPAKGTRGFIFVDEIQLN